MQYVNIRGINGSGKSETVRRLIGEYDEVNLIPARTLRDGTVRWTVGCRSRARPERIAVGSYHTQAGGLDKIQTQEQTRAAVEAAGRVEGVTVVLFEGIMTSTLYGTWADWTRTRTREGDKVTWAYIRPPLETCCARILARNGGKPFKMERILTKLRCVESTRVRARMSGIRVLDLDPTFPWVTLEEAL